MPAKVVERSLESLCNCVDFSLEHFHSEKPKTLRRPTRILFVGDDPRLQTGFGHVVKHVASFFASYSQYEVACLGWYQPIDWNTGTYYENLTELKIYNTDRDTADQFGQRTYAKVFKEYQPDIVWAIGDCWMIEHILHHRKFSGNNYKLVVYVPIDGYPYPARHTDTLKRADVVVAYGQYGKEIIEQTTPALSGEVYAIPHPIDMSVFKPVEDCDERQELEKNVGFNKKKVLVSISRNHSRKDLSKTIEAFAKARLASTTCYKCGLMAWGSDCFDTCPNCGHMGSYFVGEKHDLYLYVHCAAMDAGCDISKVAEFFCVDKYMMLPVGLTVGVGTSEEFVSQVMKVGFAYLSTTRGEGFGIPLANALACGVPVIAPDFSAYTDFLKHDYNALLYPYESHYIESDSGIGRIVASSKDAAVAIDRLYYDDPNVLSNRWRIPLESVMSCSLGEKARCSLIANGLESVKQFAPKEIGKKWVNLVNTVSNEEQFKQFSAGIKTHKKLRVAWVGRTLSNPVGGAEFSTLGIVKRLPQYEHYTIGWCVKDKVTNVFEYEPKEHYCVVTAPDDPYITEALDAIQPDVVCGYSEAVPIIGQWCESNNKVAIYFVHSFENFCSNSLIKRCLSSKCSTCNNRYMQCDSDKRLLIDSSYQYLSSGIVVSNSMWTQEFIRSRFGIDSVLCYPYISNRTILTDYDIRYRDVVGMTNPVSVKGGNVFIKLATEFPQTQFVGYSTWEDSVFDKAVRQVHNIRIERNGDVRSLYQHAKIMLQPSYVCETYGMSAAESIMNGIPCLVNDIAGLPEACCFMPTCLVADNEIETYITKLRELLECRDAYWNAVALCKDKYEVYQKRNEDTIMVVTELIEGAKR